MVHSPVLNRTYTDVATTDEMPSLMRKQNRGTFTFVWVGRARQQWSTAMNMANNTARNFDLHNRRKTR